MPRGKVKEVVDGDTVILVDGTRIRLAGVDAPELRRKGGGAAKEELEGFEKTVKGTGFDMLRHHASMETGFNIYSDALPSAVLRKAVSEIMGYRSLWEE
jgi:hypothetical protein